MDEFDYREHISGAVDSAEPVPGNPVIPEDIRQKLKYGTRGSSGCTHDHSNFQVVVESRPRSLLKLLLCIFLTCTLILSPIAFLIWFYERPTITVTYQVCQDCGLRRMIYKE